MPRKYKPTGRKPGAPKGNTNAVRHGHHSRVEKAEKLRAHAALRGAKALVAAMKLDEEAAAMEAAREAEREMEDRDAFWRKIYSDARKLPTFRGFLGDIVRNRMAAEWIGLFPDEVAPDWVYAWLDAMPNVHHSLTLDDEDNVLPYVPEGPIEEEEGGGGWKNAETTPPPVHPNALWSVLFPGRAWGSVTSFDDSVPDRLLALVPQFGSRLQAESYLRWKLRQFQAHRDQAGWTDGKSHLEGRSVGGGAPYPRNPLPWRVIGTPPVTD